MPTGEEPIQESLWSRIAGSSGTPTDKRNNLRLVAWSLAWGVGLTVVSQMLTGTYFDVEAGYRTGLIAAVPIVLFLGVMRAYLRFLRMTDELARMIQLQALAVGFGAGILLLLHWELFEVAGAPALDPSDAAMVPILAWALGLLYFARRYR